MVGVPGGLCLLNRAARPSGGGGGTTAVSRHHNRRLGEWFRLTFHFFGSANGPGAGTEPHGPAGIVHVALNTRDPSMSLGTILLIILILLLIGAVPTWPYSTGWGYYPSGGLGLVLAIVIILVLIGRI